MTSEGDKNLRQIQNKVAEKTTTAKPIKGQSSAHSLNWSNIQVTTIYTNSTKLSSIYFIQLCINNIKQYTMYVYMRHITL